MKQPNSTAHIISNNNSAAGTHRGMPTNQWEGWTLGHQSIKYIMLVIVNRWLGFHITFGTQKCHLIVISCPMGVSFFLI